MIHWDLFERFGPRMAEGFAVTLELALGSMAAALLIAIPAALGRFVRLQGRQPLPCSPTPT